MRFLIFLIFLTQFAISQTKKINLEDKIYVSVDAFVANPNLENLEILEKQEKSFQPSTKAEFLALVILNCNKGFYENQFNLTKNAISSYEKAWLIFEKQKLNNYDIIEYCLKPLGNLYTILGDFDNAENTIKQYFFIANKNINQEQKIAAILNLSNVYQSSGRSNLAINLLEKILKFEQLTNSQKGLLLNNLGSNYLLTKSYNKAKKVLELSIKLLKRANSNPENISNIYRNLSQIYSQEQNYKLANSYLQKAELEFNKNKRFEPRKKAKLTYEKALLFFEQGKTENSKLAINEAFRILIPNFKSKKDVLPEQNLLYAETILLDVLDLQAEIFIKENKSKKALESFHLSFFIENLLQEMLVYENSKIISQIRNRNRTEKCIEIYYKLYLQKHEYINLENAFVLAEKTKSAVLKSYIAKNKVISKTEKNIREQLQNLNSTIIKEQQKLELADIDIINKAIKTQNELMLTVKNSNSKNTNFFDKNIKIKKVFDKLNQDNASMVSYFSGTQNMYCFRLENNVISLFKLENANVPNAIIRQYISYFKDSEIIINDISGYNKIGNLAYRYLKIPRKSNSEKLIIVPDGILNFLPFEALITQQSKTTNFVKMHYLIRDFKVGYSNSVSFYMNSKKENKTTETVLGVFPVFENSPLELTYSKEELKYVKSSFDGKYLEKSEATFNNFKKNAQNYSILHLSTHASSGNIDEPASIRFFDEEILYSELYNLNIKPSLVVLSACETGLGKLYKSEGSMSIARGFQFAGAENLLFSLWKVNDYTTSVFMTHFYDNLKNGNSYFDANYNAKIDFLGDKSISNTKKSPYYWCPMVYYGAAENYNSTNYILLMGFVITVSLGFLGWYKTKKNRLAKNNKTV